MRSKLLMFMSAFASLFVVVMLSAWPGGSAVSVRAQNATQALGDATQAGVTATALVTQFKLSEVYQDSVYIFNYPAGWVTQAAQPGSVSLTNDPKVMALLAAPSGEPPPLATGQIAIQIMNSLGGPVSLPSDSGSGSGTAAAPTPGNTPSPTSTTSPADVVKFVELLFSDMPSKPTFGNIQSFKLGAADGSEATFSMKNDDGLVLSFYSNGQPVIVIALVASGELPKDQPLIEAIAATVQVTKAGMATLAATSAGSS